MSEYFSRTRVGLCGLALGLCLVGLPFVSAAPGPKVCDRVCVNRNYFMLASPTCTSFFPADCNYCAKLSSCQCTYFIWTDPENCKLRSGQSTLQTLYTGGCDTPCPTVLAQGATEAGQPLGAATTWAFTTQWTCD